MPAHKNKISILQDEIEIEIKKTAYKELAQKVVRHLNLQFDEISIIWVNDEFLKKLHKQYLNDDTYTDVMTFDLSDDQEKSAEIYISVDRARLNAERFGAETEEELARLVCHGLLHLSGLDDHTDAERQHMHQQENLLIREYWSQSKS